MRCGLPRSAGRIQNYIVLEIRRAVHGRGIPRVLCDGEADVHRHPVEDPMDGVPRNVRCTSLEHRLTCTHTHVHTCVRTRVHTCVRRHTPSRTDAYLHTRTLARTNARLHARTAGACATSAARDRTLLVVRAAMRRVRGSGAADAHGRVLQRLHHRHVHGRLSGVRGPRSSPSNAYRCMRLAR